MSVSLDLTDRYLADKLRSITNVKHPRPWPELLDDLAALRKLEDDWDGQGAAAPESALIDAAITLAQSLQQQNIMPPTGAIASVNGTIFFEWLMSPEYLEFEVTSGTEAVIRHLANGAKVAKSSQVHIPAQQASAHA